MGKPVRRFFCVQKGGVKSYTSLWSPSYFAATTVSDSLDVVKQYIEDQRTDEHKRKYEKRSRYWNS